MHVKVREDHRVLSKGLFVALGINQDGYKEIIGFDVYDGESKENWKEFLKGLRARGLEGPELIISDNHAVLLDHHEDWLGRSGVFSMKEYYEKRTEFLAKIPKVTNVA